MWNMNQVGRIEYRGNYVYNIVFDNGLGADIDFEPYLKRGPVFEPLMDLGYFQKAMIEGGTIAWPNGADVSPETLYEMVESANQRLHGDRTSAPLQAHR